jgi:hypothetical protein
MPVTTLPPKKQTVNALAACLMDGTVVLIGVWLIASLLGIDFLLSNNLPTGGDTASHLLYVWTYIHELLPHGYITAWMPEVFGGLPFLSYYFPLSFLSMAGLATVLPFALAMKLGMFAAAMALPGAVWLGSVYLLKLPRQIAIWGVLGILPFLLHEQNSIWGGNLLSTLAGEFAYGYGALFSVLTLLAWQRTMASGRYWWLAALLEAATGFSHGFALLITGFATAAFLFDSKNFVRNLRFLIYGHSLAFFLLAGWLWPMLQMHSLTIPNDAMFEVGKWQELLPQSMLPVALAGLLAALLLGLIHGIPWLRQRLPATPFMSDSLRHAAFMASAALLGAVGFVAGSSLGLANIRFFPFVWLFGGLACGWVWGCLLVRVSAVLPNMARRGLALMSVSAALAFSAWLGMNISVVSDWGLWNHSGLEAKPQWHRLSQLFPTLTGHPNSPRLLFEHDPANNDIGSTRTLEALPLFLGGRPVLEGLYMESALTGPAIYQLQSEVSTHPSSPLARFPSASLDLDMAAMHMNFLFANEVLIRHENTTQAFAAHRQFTKIASAAPFQVFQLKTFNSHLVDLTDRPLNWTSKDRWMENSFQWFRSRQRFLSELPVFHEGDVPNIVTPAATAQIHNINMDRHRLSWRTDAVGSAHLVRMAWHPRWQLATQGRIYLAGPGFMLVVPEESDVVLVYGHTAVGIAGMVSTFISALLLIFLIWHECRASTVKAPLSTTWPVNRLALLWPLVLWGGGLWFYHYSPERLYTRAWDLMRHQQVLEAAKLFDSAYTDRKSDAKKEEALFWSAKAYEQAGKPDLALQRYRELSAHYHGYWLAESLYTQAKLEQVSNDDTHTQEARQRLLQEFPNNRWTQRLVKEMNP